MEEWMKIFYMDDPKKNTHEACCPDMNIEDVVLSDKMGEIAENTAHTQSFPVQDSKFSRFWF